jgi:hypothetical protein
MVYLILDPNGRVGDQLEMLPNTIWEAAHLTKECARKLAYLEIFIASQTGKPSKLNIISTITLAKFQSVNRLGF